MSLRAQLASVADNCSGSSALLGGSANANARLAARVPSKEELASVLAAPRLDGSAAKLSVFLRARTTLETNEIYGYPFIARPGKFYHKLKQTLTSEIERKNIEKVFAEPHY